MKNASQIILLLLFPVCVARGCRSPQTFHGTSGVISSPNFPLNYESGQRCIWRIIVPSGFRIRLVFTSFQLEGFKSHCLYDWLEIWDGLNGSTRQLGKFCGTNPPPTMNSDSGSMKLIFRTDKHGTKTGFRAVFNAHPIGTQVRLRNGSKSSEGRVEVYHNGIWGTVCDGSWDINDANVICKMLGFPRATSAPRGAKFGRGKGRIWLDNVCCNGNETSFGNCSHPRWGSHSCDHRNDAGVICSINECAFNPCQNGGTCTDGVNRCSCAAGYTGKNCQTNINECAPNPCQNGGTCTDGVNSYTCSCVAGYTGKNCQTNINECAFDPCQNGERCTDGVNSYTCSCAAGYTGKNCQININECSPNPCQNGGTCTDGVNSYTCSCPEGITGVNCQTVAIKPSTTNGPKHEREIHVEIGIRGIEWSEDLRDTSSSNFKTLATKIEKEIRKIYPEKEVLKHVEVLSFESRGFVARIVLTFRTRLCNAENLKPLEKEVKYGRLGKLQVDPELKLPTGTAKTETKSKLSNGGVNFLLLGLIGGGVLGVNVLVIIIYLCRKHRRLVKQRILEIQTYHLTSKKSGGDLSPLVSKSNEQLVVTELTPTSNLSC